VNWQGSPLRRDRNEIAPLPETLSFFRKNPFITGSFIGEIEGNEKEKDLTSH
jgi:hypothetical protein